MSGEIATRSPTWEEAFDAEVVSVFCQAVSASRHQLRNAVRGITNDYDLGPRGPWIIGIVGKQPTSPHQLADFLAVGRSMITAELARLADAGLIEQARVESDARRSLISLTPLGMQVMERLARDVGAFLAQRLRGYSREEVMLCARMLTAFSSNTP